MEVGHKSTEYDMTLTEQQVIEIKKMLADGIKGYIIAKKYCVSGTQIARIKSGARWGNVSFYRMILMKGEIGI